MNAGTPVDSGLAVDLRLFALDRWPSAERLACLSADEVERAGRFVHARDRRRYLAARCTLRESLARHTGRPAASLKLVEGAFGKPGLAEAPACHFNLSHSQDRALLGIGGDFEIGVDIEVLQPVDALESLARSHFASAEFDGLIALAPALRNTAFLRLWTRKEACLKAIGAGLSIAPSSFAVSLNPLSERLTIDGPWGAERVELHAVDAGPQAVAALALRLTGR